MLCRMYDIKNIYITTISNILNLIGNKKLNTELKSITMKPLLVDNFLSSKLMDIFKFIEKYMYTIYIYVHSSSKNDTL